MWLLYDTRDRVVDFVNYWSSRRGIHVSHFIQWIVVYELVSFMIGKGAMVGSMSIMPWILWIEDWEEKAKVHCSEGLKRKNVIEGA